MESFRLGFSSCPNDTFMFHALVHGLVDGAARGCRPEVVMEDIEALNLRAEGAPSSQLDVTKLSVSTLGRVLDRYHVLDAGAALGHGCGPLVLRRSGGPASLSGLAGMRVAVPGLGTTAYLLLRILCPASFLPVPMRFDEIMPALVRDEVDAGLVIHEGRFTYDAYRLEAIADLGHLWEARTQLPLPLGVIAAHRRLDRDTALAVQEGLRASVAMAWAEPHRSAAYIKAHAQEIAPEVCEQHIALYVNAYSERLGDRGKEAIRALITHGQRAGVLPISAGSVSFVT